MKLSQAFRIAFIACLPVIFAAVLVMVFFGIIQIIVEAVRTLFKF